MSSLSCLLELQMPPSTFQDSMNQFFASYLRRFVIVFFDNILVYSTIVAEQVFHLTQVLTHLCDNHFFIQLYKSYFYQQKVECLGHLGFGRYCSS